MADTVDFVLDSFLDKYCTVLDLYWIVLATSGDREGQG